MSLKKQIEDYNKVFIEKMKLGIVLKKPINHFITINNDDNLSIMSGDIVEIYRDDSYLIGDHVLVRMCDNEEGLILPDTDFISEVLENI